MSTDGVEKLLGSGLVGGPGVTDVVAVLLALLASVELLSAAANHDQRAYASLSQAGSRSVGRQTIAGSPVRFPSDCVSLFQPEVCAPPAFRFPCCRRSRGLPRSLSGLVGQGRDTGLARAADRPLVAR